MRLGQEAYGIDILQFQEIRFYESPTRIANAPAHIRGVVNLRGVIVLNVGSRVTGAGVDSVADVIEPESDDIRSAPAMACTLDSHFMAGLGSITTGDVDRMLLLLDVCTSLDDADTALIGDMA